MPSFTRSVLFFFLFGLGVLLAQGPSASPTLAFEKGHTQDIIVKLDHFTDDLHSTFMGMKLATGLQERGNHVTIFLNLEAVRLADKRHPLDLGWGHTPSLQAVYEAFVKAGGRILVCPHCAEVTGLTSKNLRDGAKIAGHKELLEHLEKADKVIGY